MASSHVYGHCKPSTSPDVGPGKLGTPDSRPGGTGALLESSHSFLFGRPGSSHRQDFCPEESTPSLPWNHLHSRCTSIHNQPEIGLLLPGSNASIWQRPQWEWSNLSLRYFYLQVPTSIVFFPLHLGSLGCPAEAPCWTPRHRSWLCQGRNPV